MSSHPLTPHRPPGKPSRGLRFTTSPARPGRLLAAACLAIANTGLAAWAASPALLTATNLPPVSPSLPEVTLPLLRIFGALGIVLAVLFGGAWLVRNWQNLPGQRRRPARLQMLEMRTLGGRHALFVVGYDQQRLLIASSPAGITLLERLPPAEAGEPEPTPPPASFPEALRRILSPR